jgi:hypothetical protein
MRFAFVLAIAAVLISATNAASDCPFFCKHSDECCVDKPSCVSMNDVYLTK